MMNPMHAWKRIFRLNDEGNNKSLKDDETFTITCKSKTQKLSKGYKA